MDDFASTALYNLIASRLQTLGMDIRPTRRFDGKIDRSEKADLLGDALASLGASAIVGIGQEIHSMGSNPTLEVLTRSISPGDLLERWLRLERYYHGKHRIRILEMGQSAILLEHYSTGGGQPSAGEDLVIAGLLAALLQQIGCRGLSLDIGEPAARFIRNDVFTTCRQTPSNTSNCSIRWRSFALRNLGANLHSGSGTVADRLSEIIGDDLGRNWRLDTAARYLETSARSLQRSLAREGTSFQKVLRTVRVEHSAALISSYGFKLAEAGYACGFSDQAHFSREFKQRFNMSPSKFAEMVAPR